MPLISDPNDIILHEEDEVQQILGKTPGCLLYWGITAIAIAFLIVFTIGWLVKYPDTVAAPIVLTTEHPPIPVVARKAGKLLQLRVVEGQQLAQNDLVAILENPAKTEDVEKLEKALKQLEMHSSPLEMLDLQWEENLELGQLQEAFAAFILDFNSFKYFVRKNHIGQKHQALKKQIEQLEELNRALKKEQNILENPLTLAKKQWNRSKQLLEDGLVKAAEKEELEAKYYQLEHQKEAINSKIIANQLSMEQIKTQILDLSLEENDAFSQKWLELSYKIQQLKAELDNWKQDFVLTAPISGKVTIPQIRSAQQFVQASEEVVVIVPNKESGQLIGKAQLPNIRAGKVVPQQEVKIQLNDYPYQEFGVVLAKVQHITLVPVSANNQGDSYLVEIHLENGLKTTYGKELNFRQGMKGMAQIITNDRSILGRIFDRVLSLLWN